VKIIQNEPPAVPGSSAIGPQISPSTSSSSSASKTDASKIIINKEEVRSAVVNQEIITHIDTRQAGAGGELTATCMGAQRSAQCEFVEQPDTPGVYALKILAHEVGKHVLQIKYNDEHVPGSPFTLRVSTPPDASKVEVFGPGICHGLLENYESKFVCDTRGAGAGQLTVRIRGPKGKFE
jgi:filamin